ncbi:MAG: hypothetical protein G01um101418_162, partial [Parcubacteria group bacterium Gr01-1014_18]
LLLAVEDRGNVWYLSPITKKRMLMGGPMSAWKIIQKIAEKL